MTLYSGKLISITPSITLSQQSVGSTSGKHEHRFNNPVPYLLVTFTVLTILTY